MTCKCYHAERNFLGKIGVCWGTKECEACSCGGDESKCDFYEDKRKKATLKTTNYDCIISKTPEELAGWINEVIHNGGVIPYGGTGVTLDWLKQEAEK